MKSITLSTINAKYMHASLGLRYLHANLGDLRTHSRIVEFTLNERATDIVEKLLADRPRIVGLGIYIWNIGISTEVVKLIKKISPETIVVLGGPEISHECEQHEAFRCADYLIRGMADLAFAGLCRSLLSDHRPEGKVIEPEEFDLRVLTLPYDWYTREDVANRLIYVEASRGCPFKCEFCLSALDKTAWPFELDAFLREMDKLHQRGARHFRFVDRTFNLKSSTTSRILKFFLERMSEDLFLHFELIPDRLPDNLKELVVRFPPGSLQFEIGVQTFTPTVQELISRRQDNDKTVENLSWLRNNTNAHIHADLIFGLPGETLDSFRQSFDRLVSTNPHEIQVGILKRLRGSPIVRHIEEYDLRFNPEPPYNILSTNRIDFPTMQKMNRFARYWDLVINSGRFELTRELLLGATPFDNFDTLSDWLYASTGQTHRISMDRLFSLLQRGAAEALGVDAREIKNALDADRARFRKAVQRNRKQDTHQRTGHRKRQTRHVHANQRLH